MGACVGIVLLAGPAHAQAPPPGADKTGFAGLPESVSDETGIPFFDPGVSQWVDRLFEDMRTAIGKCDRAAYDNVLREFAKVISAFQGKSFSMKPGAQPTPQNLRDVENMKAAQAQAPPYPVPCTPLAPLPPINIWLLGGGMLSLISSSSVTGVDATGGAGNFLVDNSRRDASSSATAVAGMRVQVTKQWNAFVERQVSESTSLAVPDLLSRSRPSFAVFFETGIQSSFGAQSFAQTFQGVSATPRGFGSSTVSENFQIPILVGGSFPIVAPSGRGSMSMFLNVYGGITLDSWTQTLQGREAGAPNGAGFFGQTQRFTVDPTVGAGLQTGVGRFLFGINAELQFRPGSVVTAQSPNFSAETYYGTVDPRPNLLLMGRVGIPIGGR
jgi:hypothetical protein